MDATKQEEPKTAVPPSLQRKHTQIAAIYKDNPDLTPKELDLQDLHKALTKQGASRFDESMCQASMDHLFMIA